METREGKKHNNNMELSKKDEFFFDFDTALASVGTSGRFQWRSLILLTIVMGSAGLGVVTVIFVGLKQDFACRNNENSNLLRRLGVRSFS